MYNNLVICVKKNLTPPHTPEYRSSSSSLSTCVSPFETLYPTPLEMGNDTVEYLKLTMDEMCPEMVSSSESSTASSNPRFRLQSHQQILYSETKDVSETGILSLEGTLSSFSPELNDAHTNVIAEEIPLHGGERDHTRKIKSTHNKVQSKLNKDENPPTRSKNRRRTRNKKMNKSEYTNNVIMLSQNNSHDTIRNTGSSLKVKEVTQELNHNAIAYSFRKGTKNSLSPLVNITTPTEKKVHTTHTSVIQYYKYFTDKTLMTKASKVSAKSMVFHQRTLCRRLGLRGRVQISSEGINGTVSGADINVLHEYVRDMESIILEAQGMLKDTRTLEKQTTGSNPHAEVDWIWSSIRNEDHIFPDLKVEQVQEIVITGGSISVREIAEHEGTYLDPNKFHEMLMSRPLSGKPPVLLDIRSTFEHAVGYFVDSAGFPAKQPVEMTNFSTFEKEYCQKKADALMDRTVMMYCTDGMRCDKASAALKKCGVQEVYQLRGGIYSYLKKFPKGGMFKGKNFVFDQRVTAGGEDGDIVGRCMACCSPYDKLCGSRVCTVCRDLVLTCSNCRSSLRELHCRKHAYLATCYFTFLEPYTVEELLWQLEGLRYSRNCQTSTNVRNTLTKQILRVMTRIKALSSGEVIADPEAARRCRTCKESCKDCDGRCWGFWRR